MTTTRTPDEILLRALDDAFAAKSPRDALKILDDARAAAPALDEAAVFFHARANVFVGLDRLDDAVAAADRACDLEPGVPDFAGNLGAALVRRFRARGDKNDLELARRALEAAVDLGPRTPEVRSTLAVVLDQLGQPARALVVCDDNLRDFPDDAVTLMNRAAALKSLGRLDEVRATLVALAKHFAPAEEALKRL